MKRPYQKPTMTPIELQSAWGGPPKRPSTGGTRGSCLTGFWAGEPWGTCTGGGNPSAGGTCGGGGTPSPDNFCIAGSSVKP